MALFIIFIILHLAVYKNVISCFVYFVKDCLPSMVPSITIYSSSYYCSGNLNRIIKKNEDLKPLFQML